MSLQAEQHAHEKRMAAKNRAASFVDSNANQAMGKWQGSDFTGAAAEMGNREFAGRQQRQNSWDKEYDFRS